MDKSKLKEALRGAGLAVFLLLGAIAVYQLAIRPKAGDLNRYVNLLGNQLLAMVPEGAGKESLAQVYQDFMQKVADREVPPERVERVAAGILNLANREKVITPEQAQAVIRLAEYAPVADSVDIPKGSGPPSAPSAENWEALETRLKEIYEFNEKFREIPPPPQPGQAPLANKVLFRVEDGIKVIIDDEMKAELSRRELHHIEKKLAELDKLNLLRWQKDFDKQLERELQQVNVELERVEVILEELEYQQKEQKIKTITVVKSLQSLDSLAVPIPVNVDSILKEVQKQLKEAGVQVEAPAK